ncbi:hypothetical protein N7501_009802 [Penicillium viridicatum]|nr:hypothetical protein N7501_009802 [Penicillium viridicatum]
MESHALQHHWTTAFITGCHFKDNKENKGWERKKKTTIPTPRPAGKGEEIQVAIHLSGINTSEGDKATSELLSRTERIVEHDGWYGDMMEGVVVTVKLQKLNWNVRESM